MKSQLKVALLALLLCAAPSVRSQELVIEIGLVMWESTIVALEGANRAYAMMFYFDPVARAYFSGRADAYADLLVTLRDKPSIGGSVLPRPQ
jgi:hypothetical protein